jgi:ketosteroid isomerase-like protein
MKSKHKALITILLICTASLSLPLQSQQPPTRKAPPASDVEQMQRVEDSWSNSIMKKDQYGLELVLSPMLVDISASGDVTTRNQQIARLFQVGAEPLGLDQKVVSVRMLGDVAVVNGTYVMRHRESNQLMDEKGVFSHVFERVRGNWQCINSQRTTVADQPLQKTKQATKKSNSELPFHIPLLHQGAASDQQTPTQVPTPAPPSQ